MRSMFEIEEDQEVRGRHSGARGRDAGNAEITLGTRSLLGIFFGLVLVCGVFFGLGYSVGRVGSSHAAAPSDPAALTADNHLAKPSAEQQSLTPAPPPVATDGNDGGAPPSQDNGGAPAVTGTSGTSADGAAGTDGNAADSSPAKTPPTSRPMLTPAALNQPTAAPGALMVQVAAVRVQQDADILVAALKKHGYDAVVRNEPQDALLHIQLGPFTTRADAMAMRTKLLADGYNAVVK